MFLLLCLVQIFELEQDEEYHIPHNSPVKPRKSPSLILDQKKVECNEKFPKYKIHDHFKGFIFFTTKQSMKEFYEWIFHPSLTHCLSFSFSSHSFQIDALFYFHQYHSKQQQQHKKPFQCNSH